MFNFEAILVGAIAGLALAVSFDLHAWKLNPGEFDWKLASKRWAAGAVGGAITVILAQVESSGFGPVATQNA